MAFNEDAIRAKAYEIWVQAGKPEGQAVAEWYEAEAQLATVPVPDPVPVGPVNPTSPVAPDPVPPVNTPPVLPPAPPSGDAPVPTLPTVPPVNVPVLTGTPEPTGGGNG